MNYLRVRGEYRMWENVIKPCGELPPRTRRIQRAFAYHPFTSGTTSAYAENTRGYENTGKSHRNYLRVRGEYRTTYCNTHHTMELPPRTRRIPDSRRTWYVQLGTTSAYAENTAYLAAHPPPNGNYLRVRGEYQPPQHIHPQN